jgi:hypothetical protein
MVPGSMTAAWIEAALALPRPVPLNLFALTADILLTGNFRREIADGVDDLEQKLLRRCAEN